MSPGQLLMMKRCFAIGAAAPILLAYLVIMILSRAGLLEAAVVLVNFLPAFLPAAAYYLWVTHPRAVVLCGVILLAFTAPPWLMVSAGDPQHFSQGSLFLGTLVATTVGVVMSKDPVAAAG